MSAKATLTPGGAAPALTADLSNVIQFNSAKRDAQIADQQAASKTLDEFVRLVREHGCCNVTLMGCMPNGAVIHGFSHRSSDDGLAEVPSPSVWVTEGDEL